MRIACALRSAATWCCRGTMQLAVHQLISDLVADPTTGGRQPSAPIESFMNAEIAAVAVIADLAVQRTFKAVDTQNRASTRVAWARTASPGRRSDSHPNRTGSHTHSWARP